MKMHKAINKAFLIAARGHSHLCSRKFPSSVSKPRKTYSWDMLVASACWEVENILEVPSEDFCWLEAPR